MAQEGHYRGVRERPCGRYTTEIRNQWKKTRVWLGTFDTPNVSAVEVAATAAGGDDLGAAEGGAPGNVNWPRDNLRLSIHTPVRYLLQMSFGRTEVDHVAESSMLKLNIELNGSKVIFFVVLMMILMSGLGQNSLEELSSERNYDDCVPHLCNMLRFAVLKKDQYLMAIGGPWDTVDSGDPSSVDDSSLVQTVLRCKLIVLEPLQIHYDRVGKDGLFSHKEVTVLFLSKKIWRKMGQEVRGLDSHFKAESGFSFDSVRGEGKLCGNATGRRLLFSSHGTKRICAPIPIRTGQSCSSRWCLSLVVCGTPIGSFSDYNGSYK
ncbi:hypothetical protein RHSIM_Rhsim04G0150600 [Rhododendron simsii]|uniref:AP2/ERF domain-containing protein n=1 Tax=Rhododendron simsii TaxID=118357 RepID=A0A834HB21_RHOSS|nr:hypothetical protein RHSIM_Rhsim04G0150600 [Rhododendron simsii]